jgi:alkylation response protein AidB-like acyl-CoA dehydrogenase
MAFGKSSKWAGSPVLTARWAATHDASGLFGGAVSRCSQAFGKNLVDQPMMRQVLGQMALRLEGQTAFCSAWRGRGRVVMTPEKPLGAPVYAGGEVCHLQIRDPFVAEAMEVLGGIGYCEESELPRLYREMPVNSIWEGSGNIMCLDVMRVLASSRRRWSCWRRSARR